MQPAQCSSHKRLTSILASFVPFCLASDGLGLRGVNKCKGESCRSSKTITTKGHEVARRKLLVGFVDHACEADLFAMFANRGHDLQS